MKIISISREVTGISIIRNEIDPKKKLNLSFDILEQNDGISVKKIHAGNLTAAFSMSGEIEGVRHALNDAPARDDQYWTELFRIFKAIIIFTLLFAGSMVGTNLLESGEKTAIGEWVEKYVRPVLVSIFMLLLIGGALSLLYMVFTSPFQSAKINAATNVEETIPRLLKDPPPNNEDLRASPRAKRQK